MSFLLPPGIKDLIISYFWSLDPFSSAILIFLSKIPCKSVGFQILIFFHFEFYFTKRRLQLESSWSWHLKLYENSERFSKILKRTCLTKRLLNNMERPKIQSQGGQKIKKLHRLRKIIMEE